MVWNDIIGHERPKKILREAISRSSVAHAYLFHGPDAIGKTAVAVALARTLQCEGPDRLEACGDCRSCRAIAAGSHPDVSIVSPENHLIKIERIRDIQDALVFKPLSGARKILILAEADALNAEAANCFLKTLEEPPDHSLILLVTSRPHRLPATILSRCQQIRFDVPSEDQLVRHLIEHRNMTEPQARLLAALSLGRPGEALGADTAETVAGRDAAVALLDRKALEDLHRLFENAQARSADQDDWIRTLDWIQIWLRDALLIRSGARPDRLINRDRRKELSGFAVRHDPSAMLRAFHLAEAHRRSLHRNLNRVLALETLLLDLRQPPAAADA